MKEELVSIITPTYNSQGYLEQTINSVLNQTYKDWELLITDDCSTDGTVEVVRSFAEVDTRIKLFRLSKNSGPGIARNNSIAEANGRYIAFLDSDDIWHPEKLKHQLTFMDAKSAELSFTSYAFYSSKGAFIKKIIAKEKVKMSDMLRANYIGCSTAIYDQSVLGKIYMPEIRKRQDYGLWVRIIEKCKVAYGLDISLTKYVVRPNSVSRNKLKVLKYQWVFYKKVVGLSYLNSVRSTLLWFFYSVLGIKNKGK